MKASFERNPTSISEMPKAPGARWVDLIRDDAMSFGEGALLSEQLTKLRGGSIHCLVTTESNSADTKRSQKVQHNQRHPQS
jgi:hypothetical protein